MNDKGADKKIALIITACAAYADLLQINLQLMKKYWPDCAVEKICVVDVLDQRVESLRPYFDQLLVEPQSVSGRNLLRVRKALEQVHTPYVMMIQDDFFLYDFVDNAALRQTVQFAEAHNAGTISLVYKYDEQKQKMRGSQEPVRFQPCAEGEAYRISMQNVFWKTTYLKTLVDAYESPADFERLGSRMSASMPESVYVMQSGKEVYPNVDAINRGKWRLGMTNFLQKENIQYDNQKWPELSAMEIFCATVRKKVFLLSPKLVTALMANLPWRKKY